MHAHPQHGGKPAYKEAPGPALLPREGLASLLLSSDSLELSCLVRAPEGRWRAELWSRPSLSAALGRARGSQGGHWTHVSRGPFLHPRGLMATDLGGAEPVGGQPPRSLVSQPRPSLSDNGGCPGQKAAVPLPRPAQGQSDRSSGPRGAPHLAQSTESAARPLRTGGAI